jgi:cell division protein FtsI (penicillin-binding protein 3)
LEGVSQEGTGKAYFSSKHCPFSSGSKTGTAQVEAQTIGKPAGDYYLGSMVTYFPADNPRYTIMTAIVTSKPTREEIINKERTYYGAGLAGPVQQSVANYLYNRDISNAKKLTKDKFTIGTWDYDTKTYTDINVVGPVNN